MGAQEVAEARVVGAEVVAVELDDPSKARFEGIGGFIDIVSVQRQARFEAEGITASEASRFEAKGLPLVEQQRPELGRVSIGTEYLHAIFAGISGPRHHAGNLSKFVGAEVKSFQVRAAGPFRAQLRKDIERLRSLYGYQCGIGRLVFESTMVFGCFRKMRGDLVVIRSVADHHPAVFAVTIYQ